MGATGDALGLLGLDVKPFQDALAIVDAEMADLLIESQKLNAEIKLLERNMYAAGGGTKAQTKELKELTAVSEDFTEQIKRAKDEQKAFQSVISQSTPKLDEAAKSGYNLSNSLGSLGRNLLQAVGIGSLVEIGIKIHHAADEAAKLNEEIDKIGIDRGNPEFKTLSQLEQRITKINDALDKLSKGPSYSDAGASVLAQLGEDPLKYATTFLNNSAGGFNIGGAITATGKQSAEDIAKRQAGQQTQLLAEKEKADAAIAEKKKNDVLHELDKQNQDDQWKLLEEDEKVWQEHLKKVNSEAEAAAKDRKANDEQNQKDQFELYDADEKEWKDLQDKKTKDAAEAAKKRAEIEAMAAKNAQAAFSAGITTDIGKIAADGNSLSAQEEGIRQQFADRKRQAYNDQNPALADELDKQQAQALRHVRAQQAEQSVRSRIAERDASRKETRDADRQTAREERNRNNYDVDPFTGEKVYRSPEAKRQAEKDEINRKLDANVDKAKADPSKGKGYNATDREYLKSIAESLKPKT